MRPESPSLTKNPIRTALNANQIRAAILVAEDEIADHEIAQQCGITKATLERWKHFPLFQARVSEHIQTLNASLERYAIARRDMRMRRYNERWTQIEQLRAARAVEYGDIPGGETGLVVKRVKSIGYGADAELVEEYAADTALMAEERNLAKQAAQELGQWSDKLQTEHTGPGGGPIRVKRDDDFDYDKYQRLLVDAIAGGVENAPAPDGSG